MREVVEHVGSGGAGRGRHAGKGRRRYRGLVQATDVDGLNVAFAISPGDFEDIADMLVPELTRRGRYKSAYAEGALREAVRRRRAR